MTEMSAAEYFGSSLAFFDVGQVEKAIELCSVGIEKYPNYADLHMLRSTFYEAQGNYDAALEDVTSFIALEPERARGYDYRGHLLIEIQRFEDAEKDYNRAIEIEPDLHGHYFRIGIAQLKQGKSELGAANLRKHFELRGIEDIDEQIEKSISRLNE